MIGRREYITADVFTDVRFGGNQLAVVLDGTGLTTDEMQAITREFNYAESTFVLPPENPAHAARVRIFTIAHEMPFAGHPTVGTAFVLAALRRIPLTGDETRIVLELNVGPTPVVIRAVNGVPVFTQLSTATLPEVGPPPPTRATLAAMLGLEANDLGSGTTAPQAVSCGFPFLIVPVKDRAALAKARLKLDLYESGLANWWAKDVYLFTRTGCDEGFDVHARMFGPGAGVPEDPATGSAAAALAGYLAARESAKDGTFSWAIAQGLEMGRPSRIEIEADKTAGAVSAVRVGGRSVLVARGELLAE
jgi:trans-2,3-dihydro-3-hydroxyanthranilate isomerase